MSVITSMPRRVAIAINDLVDSCAEIKSGQQVLIVAASDGLSQTDFHHGLLVLCPIIILTYI